MRWCLVAGAFIKKKFGRIFAKTTPQAQGLACSVLLFSLSSLGCSPGFFFGDDEDHKINQTPQYRKINAACAAMDISSPTLTVSSFKKLLGCFNAYGGLDEFARLTDRMEDAELQTLLNVVNEHLLTQPKRLYELERTFFDLRKTQKNGKPLLNEAFDAVAALLENDRLVASALALLYDAGIEFDFGTLSRRMDPDVLIALEILSSKMNLQSLKAGLDAALTVVDSEAYHSLENRLLNGPSAGVSLQKATFQTLKYLQNRWDPVSHDLGDRVIEQVLNGNVFRLFDDLLEVDKKKGVSHESFRRNVPRIASVFKGGLVNQGQSFDHLSSLFHHLNGPIHCLDGVKSVSNGIYWSIDQLLLNRHGPSGFIKRNNVLTLAAMNPFCDYPAALPRHYSALSSMADLNSIHPTVEVLSALTRVKDASRDQPLLHLLIDFLGDTGSAEWERIGGPSQNTAGIKDLIPVLVELNEKNIWEDLLLLLAMPEVKDRDALMDLLYFFHQERAELQGKSLIDVFTKVVTGASPSQVYEFLSSLHQVMRKGDLSLVSSLSTLRSALFVNNVNPLMEIANTLMSQARNHEELYLTVLKVASWQEFRDSLRRLSELSRTGELERLMAAVVTLYHQYSSEGKGSRPIVKTPEPIFAPKRAHNLSSHDLIPFVLAREPHGVSSACERIDLSFSLDRHSDPRFDSQLQDYLDCLNGDFQYGDVIHLVNYLRSHKVGGEGQKDFFQLQIDLTKDFAQRLDRNEIEYLADQWIYHFDGSFLDLLKGFPLFTSMPFRGGEEAGSLVLPLLKMLGPVSFGGVAERAFQRIQKFGADLLMRWQFPYLMEYAQTIYRSPKAPDLPSGVSSYDYGRIDRWVHNKECWANPIPGSRTPYWERRRTLEILNQYEDAVTSWDLVSHEAEDLVWNLGKGSPRQGWKKEELKKCIGGAQTGASGPEWCEHSLYQKLVDPSQSSSSKTILQGLLNVLKYFSISNEIAGAGKEYDYSTVRRGQKRQTARGRHYAQKDLVRWLHERSHDHQLITYFYPGEDKPRTRLVNSLDRLELILINADMDLSGIDKMARWSMKHLLGIELKDNFALHFLTMLGEAWGDEPESIWPQEILAKQARGERILTLRESYLEIEKVQRRLGNLMGLPQVPFCQQISNPHDPRAIQEYETTDPRGTTRMPNWAVNAFNKGGITPDEMRASLFNIYQVSSVILENLPTEPGTTASADFHPHAGGMRILRDLFYELLYSSPTPEDRTPEAGWNNNLSFVIQAARMGVVRQISRRMRSFEGEEPVLQDFFSALIEASAQPLTFQLFEKLLIDDYKKNPHKAFEERLIWKVLDQVFDLLKHPNSKGVSDQRLAELREGKCSESWQLDLSDSRSKTSRGRSKKDHPKGMRISPSLETEWACELAHMRQAVFYGLAQLSQKKPSGKPALVPTSDLIRASLQSMVDVLARDLPFLEANVHVLRDLLRWRGPARYLRGFYDNEEWRHKEIFGHLIYEVLDDSQKALDAAKVLKAAYEDPLTSASWGVFWDRYEAFKDSNDHRKEPFINALEDVYNYFRDERRDCQAALRLGSSGEELVACKVRAFLAERIETGDLDQLINLIAGHYSSPKECDSHENQVSCGARQFHEVLKTFSKYIENGQLEDFFRLARDSIQ
jgi:hypothetical protein